VLEIGPGLGYWVDIFSQFNQRQEDGSRRLTMYGVEPNPQVHAGLQENINKAGLKDVYQIAPVGIQSLSTLDKQDSRFAALQKGQVDCIVSFLCLCSIPEPEENIRELYQYLKQGGRWYLYEHVQTRGFWLQLYQRKPTQRRMLSSWGADSLMIGFVNIFWPRCLNGCQLCRNTKQTLLDAGPWSRVDLTRHPEDPWHAVVPHVVGVLQK
jgi:SAM-dependent methyltransferase